MDIRDRIIQIIESKGVSRNAFEKAIGVSKSYLANTKSISADVASNVCLVYSDVSAEWLLRGEGNMIKRPSEIVSEGNLNLDISMNEKDKLLQLALKEIDRLEKEVADLRRKYESFEERQSV